MRKESLKTEQNPDKISYPKSADIERSISQVEKPDLLSGKGRPLRLRKNEKMSAEKSNVSDSAREESGFLIRIINSFLADLQDLINVLKLFWEKHIRK